MYQQPVTAPQKDVATDLDFMSFCGARFEGLRSFVHAQCADEYIVDDVVHHTFIAALGAWPRLGALDDPTDWLETTARAKLSSALKRSALRNEPVSP
jgi:DNA-directed RNA polymerase specialized sigma24 family protein